MINLINTSGSDELGVANFYKITNRFGAREFENSKALSFINPNTLEIKEDYAYYHESCPLCSAKDAAEIFNKDGFHHYKCCSCNLIFVNPCLKQDIILENVYGATEYPFFDSVNSDSQRQFDKIRFDGIIDFLIKNFPEKKSVYDIGCGSGYFLKLCKDSGFDKFGGIDPLEKAKTYATEVLSLENITYGDYCSLDNLNVKYDVVAMWELLDHVVLPNELLKIACKMLNPNGIIIISVRNGFSLAARVLREKCNMFLGYAHTNFWNVESFNLVCKEHNLDLLQLKTYISELSAVSNYLQYENIYSGKTDDLKFLPTQQHIIDSMLGYKFIAVLQKK